MFTRRESMSVAGASVLVLSSPRIAFAQGNPRPQPADWVDPQFTQPYIDTDEMRDAPVRHRYVHCGFKGTDALFSLHFGPKELYQGRFFQYVNATSGNEKIGQTRMGGDSPIGFSIASGAYFIESNLGRRDAASGNDGTLTGWRTSAAVARFARQLALEMYGGRRPFGYMYGGSGGGYKTMSAMENTIGIWDGGVPYIIGSPMALPNVYTVRRHALRLLKDKIVGVVDAIEPGGSGDMYAGLDPEQRAALLEATRFGFPPRTWAFYETLRGGGGGAGGDAAYFEDFWKVPGYLGANPPVSLLRDRIQLATKISRILSNEEVNRLSPLPVQPTIGSGGEAMPIRLGLALERMPTADPLGARLLMKSGAAATRTLTAGSTAGDVIVVTVPNKELASSIRAGDEIEIDNSNFLASQTFHRHQVPSRDYVVWDQFRGTDGRPFYPQRARLQGPITAANGAGSVQTGRFRGKMIVVSTLMDEAALPWNAAWYDATVRSVFGPRTDDNYRHWFVDNALHGANVNGKHNARIINYTGILQQALRDVAAWAERGIAPPATTNYRMVDGQIIVPATAAARKGVQPVVTLTANGGTRADVKVGQSVNFAGTVEVPPGTGRIVLAEWDFEGAGDYPVKGEFKNTKATGSQATVTTTYAFTRPGTYFPALRVGSQRRADGTAYAIARNLARVRVVVV